MGSDTIVGAETEIVAPEGTSVEESKTGIAEGLKERGKADWSGSAGSATGARWRGRFDRCLGVEETLVVRSMIGAGSCEMRSRWLALVLDSPSFSEFRGTHEEKVFALALFFADSSCLIRFFASATSCFCRCSIK